MRAAILSRQQPGRCSSQCSNMDFDLCCGRDDYDSPGSAGGTPMRRSKRVKRTTPRMAAADPEDLEDRDYSGGSGADTPSTLREKNREAQRRFRERQKVGCCCRSACLLVCWRCA